MKTLYQGKNLFYSYDRERIALDALDISINQHEKTVLLGCNGAGKSTFIQMLNGILKPLKGEISYKGEPFKYNKKALKSLRKNVGIVLQDPDLQLFSPQVIDELVFGPINFGVEPDEAVSRARRIMKELNMEYLMELPTTGLSYGQKKQVAIASIMTCEPETLVLDEPFAGLDPLNAGMVRATIDLLVDEMNITPIISTHDVEFAYEWADRILVFKEGKCILDGPPEQVFKETETIKQCHLRKPILFELYESLSMDHGKIPRNREDFKELLKNIS